MTPALFAFDLDGTLLDSNRRVRPANAAALRAISGAAGAVIALASGRLGAGVRRYAAERHTDAAGGRARRGDEEPAGEAHGGGETGYGID